MQFVSPEVAAAIWKVIEVGIVLGAMVGINLVMQAKARP